MSLLVSTVGSASANSYGSRQESITYFQLTAHPEAETWARLEDHLKDAYLIQATRDIELQRLAGVKKTTSKTTGVPDQALHFPVSSNVDGGTAFIPLEVKHAQFEQALHRSKRGTGSTVREQAQIEGVRSISYGDVSETYGTAEKSPMSILAQQARVLLLRHGHIVTKGPVKI